MSRTLALWELLSQSHWTNMAECSWYEVRLSISVTQTVLGSRTAQVIKTHRLILTRVC